MAKRADEGTVSPKALKTKVPFLCGMIFVSFVPKRKKKTTVPQVGNPPTTSEIPDSDPENSPAELCADSDPENSPAELCADCDPYKSPAELYLELTTICMEQADVMTSLSSSSSPKFNHEQCEYLTQKLRVAVQNAHLFFEEIKTWYSICAPPEDRAQSLEIFKLLQMLSKEVESFIQSCCKEEWIQSAIMLKNATWEHTSSIGFNLEFCTFVFSARKDLGAIPSLTHEEIVRSSQAEAATVKEMVNRDESRLSTDLRALIKRPTRTESSIAEKQLATFLLERLIITRLDADSDESLGSFQSSQHHDVLANSLTRLERMGHGASGTVHKAKWLGAEVANKSFHGPGNPEFLQEVSILAGLNHPNIVSLFWCTSDEHKCHIIMELMDKDLNTLMEERLDSRTIRKHPGPFTISETLKMKERLDSRTIKNHPPFTISETLDISLQVAEGLLFLHDRNIVHRDIKSYNILMKLVKTTLKTTNEDIVNEHMLVKVADFGLSRTKERSVTYSNQTENVGTARWMAPEVIKFRDCDGTVGVTEDDDTHSITSKHPFQSDVYSFGMVCYEILTGRVPFSTVGSPNEVKKMVLRGLRPQLPEHCPSKLKTLIEACWSPEASKRPRFREICAQLRELRCAHLITTTWAAWVKVPRCFSLDEIKSMTDDLNHDNFLKSVSYRQIWKGVMVDTGEVVAVDRILEGYFKRKLKVLPGIDHKNVVRCVGFCHEQDILLYEDMPTSTLSDWHEGDKKDVSHKWPARKTISFGVAHGIHHLHTVPKIIHRAIQPDDILLNANLEPKLTGFGWSDYRDVVSSAQFVYNKFETYRRPWRAPEYDITGKLSEKVDVYSYGLVLLEVVSGTRVGLPTSSFRVSSDKDHLERAWTLHSEGRTPELIDHTLNLQQHEYIEAVRMIWIAFLCLHSEPETRPDMNLVVEMLHGNRDEEILRLGVQHGQETRRGGESIINLQAMYDS